jgi:hypothetical protein
MQLHKAVSAMENDITNDPANKIWAFSFPLVEPLAYVT